MKYKVEECTVKTYDMELTKEDLVSLILSQNTLSHTLLSLSRTVENTPDRIKLMTDSHDNICVQWSERIKDGKEETIRL